jgi:serine/threonine protein phosphatase 1
MRKFVIGDIHGAHKALVECLKGVEFDYDNDMLIFLGDVVDGWSDVIPCIEELMKIKNLVFIKGNHDDWALSYIKGYMDPINESWLRHGGQMTKSVIDENPAKYMMIKLFLENSVPYYIDDNNIFIHAGFNQNGKLEYQEYETFMWDRNMVKDAIANKIDDESFYNPNNMFNKIFVGHTSTTKLLETDQPTTVGKNIIMIDTGAAFKGKLTIMNVEDNFYFQSTPYLLYPDELGRNKPKDEA